MKYNDFNGRMLIELYNVSSRKIMENGENEVGNCSLAELTDKQNAEDEQFDNLTKREQQPEDCELAADDRTDGWNNLSMAMNETSAQADGWMAAWAAILMKSL